MADDEIVIPVKIETDDAKRALDDLASTASETFDRVVAKQASNAGITPEEFTRRGRDFADNGPKFAPPESEPDQTSEAPHGPRERPGSGGKEGHGVRYINVEQELLGETSQSAAESTAGIRLFREALHALHPALAEAGIGVGELSALVSAARGGFIALGIAIGTLVVTALERAGDAANDAAARLGAFSGGIAAGKEQYGRLSETADQLKTPTSGLVAPFEQATRLNQSQPQATQLPESGLLEAIGNVVKGGQSERADTTKVLEALTKLLSDGREKGILGPDDFKALENIAPRTAAAVIDQLPKGQSVFSGGQVLGAIRAAGPQIDANSVEALKLPDSIPTAWEHVKASYEKLAEATTGGHAVSSALEGLAQFMGGAADRIKRAAAESQKAQEEFNPGGLRQSAPLSFQRPEFQQGGIANPRESLGAFDAENTSRLTPEANKAADALSKLTDAVDPLQKTLNAFHITQQDALTAKSTDLNLRQSVIDKKYEPAETAKKLERAEIAIQSASINAAQAQINGLEALKNLDLSKLSRESSQENLNSAQSRLSKAEHNYFQAHGIADNYNEELEKRRDSENELAAAVTAVRRAQIERRYAYLEEPKAALAAEQAQTAIQSAELEKSDASLRFNKQSDSGPLSHELQQLKYSEAALKQDEQQTKYQGEALGTLKEILSTLQHRDQPKELFGDDKTKAEKLDTATTDDAAAERKFKQRADSSAYDIHARRTGERTVEGDQRSRELAFSQGKPFGTEQSVEGDRIAREKAFGQGKPFGMEHTVDSDGLNGAASNLKEAASALKEAAGKQTSTATGTSEQHPPETTVTKEGFQRKLDEQVEELKRDFKSQSDFSEQIGKQNGGVQKLKPGGMNLSYEPSVPGHYDAKTQEFVPDPSRIVKGLSRIQPKNNDYDFAGQKNPAGPYQPGISAPISFPDYIKQRMKTLPSESPAPVPLPQPRPPEADQVEGQQFAGLGNQVQQFIDAVTAKLGTATAQPTEQQLPITNMGIRGDADSIDQPASNFKEALSALTGAIEDASQRITKSSDVVGQSSSVKQDDVQQVAGGGHIRGPGTSTSDSIPAMLSDGEFVVKEEAVRRIGVDNLHAMNDGNIDHLAGGGEPDKRKKKHHKSHSSFVLTDEDRRAIDEVGEDYNEDTNYQNTTAARGGLITLRGLVQHFARGGAVNVPPALRHFNLGGLASRISHATAPTIALASGGVASSAPAAAKSEMEHWGTIDMRTSHGDVRVATERDTMRHVSSNAQKAKRYSTGPKPGWFGG